MKPLSIITVATILCCVGCVYESPLSREHTIPVDPALLGLWELVSENETAVNINERMLIMKYSNTEYCIYHPVWDKGVFWRAYPIKVGDISCVQLQAIGTDKGPVPSTEKKRFNVASYQLNNGELTIKTLNTNLVGIELKGSESLNKKFLEHQDNKNLFSEPGRFKKINKED